MAAFREALTIDCFTAFGTDQAQAQLTTKCDNESIIWVQSAATLKTQ
jgi:hypothetical protein